MIDVVVIGAGIAGLATAARLQARGLSTIVCEAHGQPGGCAGFFRRRGFAFDVGATTLVDFEPGGVGGELYQAIGMPPPAGEALPGYVAWLPDRSITLHRDSSLWSQERLAALGNTPAHRRFWTWMDRLAAVFWHASRAGVKLPIQRIGDAVAAARALGWAGLPQCRYLGWTMGDALRTCGLREERPLVGLLSMLLEDTVHAGIDSAPLINGALGITIRGAGLSRARGGMYGFWQAFVDHYRQLGGVLKVGCPVGQVRPLRQGGWVVQTRRGDLLARQVVSALPVSLTSRIGPPAVANRLKPYLERDAASHGGAIVVFLGVPEAEAAGQDFTHHQLLQDYGQPLGNGNNMFISVSAPGDTLSAPPGCRSVMISTHCDLADWQDLTPDEYQERKAWMGQRLIDHARRVYPELGRHAEVLEIGTPCTYERFTHRPGGAVGGQRLHLGNCNQRAVPHDIGVPDFWLAGDTTWPGLGTVACVLGSRLVADAVRRQAAKHPARSAPSTAALPPIPRLETLGADLLLTTPRQRWWSLARPFLGLAAFAAAAWLGWWWLTPVVVFLIFVAVVTVTHDVVHGALGLGPRQTDWALFICGAVLLESGHAYRATHLQHHRNFPGPDDPEGDPARMSLWQAVLCGPIFLIRLWCWAYRQGRDRGWLLAEAAWAILVLFAGVCLLPWTPAILLYAGLAIVGSWVYPLLTVHLPHHHYGDHPLTQTSSLRGVIIPRLFLELTYHLEHHLYPAVPSHRLAELARRLDPFLDEAKVERRRVW